jgi:hypothetical protein
MAQDTASIRGSAYFFMPLIDATMSCRLVLSLRDADNTQFNSNVVKSLWATSDLASEDQTEEPASNQHGGNKKNDTFALATVDRLDANGMPVQIKCVPIIIDILCRNFQDC